MRTIRDEDRTKETVTFEGVRCTRATDSAILCVIEDGQQVWIPKSQVHDDSEVYDEGHSGNLVVTAWIAEQKGLV